MTCEIKGENCGREVAYCSGGVCAVWRGMSVNSILSGRRSSGLHLEGSGFRVLREQRTMNNDVWFSIYMLL